MVSVIPAGDGKIVNLFTVLSDAICFVVEIFFGFSCPIYTAEEVLLFLKRCCSAKSPLEGRDRNVTIMSPYRPGFEPDMHQPFNMPGSNNLAKSNASAVVKKRHTLKVPINCEAQFNIIHHDAPLKKVSDIPVPSRDVTY